MVDDRWQLKGCSHIPSWHFRSELALISYEEPAEIYETYNTTYDTKNTNYIDYIQAFIS